MFGLSAIGEVAISAVPLKTVEGGPSPHFIRRSNAMTGGMIGMGLTLLIWLVVI